MSAGLEEHYDKIYKYCYMKIRHRQIAEDITQGTFLRFLETHQYKEMDKRLPFLYTIARNLCIDHFRKKNEIILTEELIDEGIEDGIVRTMILKHAVEKLTTEEQELIFLRYVNEVSINQISQIMGISRYAIYRKTKECLKKLEKELREEMDF